jgi:hypothetical protein
MALSLLGFSGDCRLKSGISRRFSPATITGLGSGEKIGQSLFSLASGTSGLPSPISHLPSVSSRPPGTPFLFNCCWCVHLMRAGAALYKDTAPRATGRSDGRDRELWMGCRASLTVAVLDVRRMGMRCGRAPQIAIPPSRPATPRARSARLSQSFRKRRTPISASRRLPYVS